MSFTLEFHDSEVRDVVADGGGVRVRFSAASVRGADGLRGWLTSVVLTLADAPLAGGTPGAFGKITEGRLRQEGVAVTRLPLPARLAGALELSLRFASGSSLSVRAAALTLAAAPDAVFTEDHSC
jgi:hypothetical protein